MSLTPSCWTSRSGAAAEHGHAVDHRSVLDRVVVDESDGRVSIVARRIISHHHLARVARAHDEGALALLALRRTEPHRDDRPEL